MKDIGYVQSLGRKAPQAGRANSPWSAQNLGQT